MVIVSCIICNQQDHIRYARSYSNFSPDTFNDELQRLMNDYMKINDLHNTNADNINILFDQFYSLVTKIIDKHAPMEKISRRKKRLDILKNPCQLYNNLSVNPQLLQFIHLNWTIKQLKHLMLRNILEWWLMNNSLSNPTFFNLKRKLHVLLV